MNNKYKIMKKYFALCLAIGMGILSSCHSSTPLNLKVMTFNIRMDTPVDGDYSWEHRKECAGQMVKEQNCDLIGTHRRTDPFRSRCEGRKER